MALTPKQIKALHDKMLHKKLYVIFSDPTEKGGGRRKIFPRHIAYQLELERKGILFAAGPFTDAKGNSTGSGMIVIRAKSMAAARRIASNDPLMRITTPHDLRRDAGQAIPGRDQQAFAKGGRVGDRPPDPHAPPRRG